MFDDYQPKARRKKPLSITDTSTESEKPPPTQEEIKEAQSALLKLGIGGMLSGCLLTFLLPLLFIVGVLILATIGYVLFG